MNHEHEQSHASSPTAVTADKDTVEPGQSSRSALLRKPEHAITSGLVQRKARDANGVADGAAQAVSAASLSSGSPLPESLMRKFESSLGADLSGVRVHTGGASEHAADAVGAKAYTLGNDIHFGAGHYDPASSGGQHLLAHEVAHTVQQSRGAQRMQFKLEVSSPQDHFEHAADRAADAMVAGQPVMIASAPASAARTIQRQVADAGTATWSKYLPFAKGRSFAIDGPAWNDGDGDIIENRANLLQLSVTINGDTAVLSFHYKAEGAGNTASAKTKKDLITDSNVTILSSTKARIIQLSKPIVLDKGKKIDRVSFSAVDAIKALMILRIDGTDREFDLTPKK